MSEEKNPEEMSIEEIDAELTKMSESISAEQVLQLRNAIKKFFEERKVAYNRDTLVAALIMCNLIESTVPPMFATAITAARLCLYRLVKEEGSGFVTSPIQPSK